MDTKNNLNLTYDWFETTVAPGVISSVHNFFENNYEIALSSISTFDDLKSEPLLKNELFYSCRISIKNKQHITSRVTSNFIRIIFHDLFGSNEPVFDLEKLTELEQKILNSFFEYIVKNIDKFLIRETEQNKIDPLNKKNVNLTFLIQNNGIQTGKLCLSIPLNRLELKPVELINNFENDDFINNFAYVDILTGCAKISLDELKNLSKDDILVLEKSNIKTLTIKTETVAKEFKVNPEPSIMIDVEGDIEEEINEYKGENMPENKSLWDDIQIEVSAEFKKVKMTLGELKQISKGLVIDLGPVIKNEISLLVENKTVAKGELVIINDKYGVRINEVFASKKQEEKTAEAPAKPAPSPQAPPPAPKPAPKPVQQKPVPPAGAKMPPPKPVKPQTPPQSAKQDFDYSNFEE